jgi:hypothetical protein
MDVTIKRISDAESNYAAAYQYPRPASWVIRRFAILSISESLAKFCSATVYDAAELGCNQDIICDVVKKSTTRSVINMEPDLVDLIPENEHLLYISPSGGKEPAFISRNRDRWWEQQTSNSSTFYLSPQDVKFGSGRFVISWEATIAHIFISLITPSRLRLRLLHGRLCDISVSIQEDSNELRRIPTNEIPEGLRLQDFELDQFEPGRHELELVVMKGDGSYCLRDILMEFFNDPPSHSSVDKDGDNPTAREYRGVADAEPGGIRV